MQVFGNMLRPIFFELLELFLLAPKMIVHTFGVCGVLTKGVVVHMIQP